MSDAFVMRWKLDRPSLDADRSEDVYALLTIEPNPAALAAGPGGPTIPMHLILLVDVSGSINVPVRHDPHAQKIGEGHTEGKLAHRRVSDAPTRRDMARSDPQKM